MEMPNPYETPQEGETLTENVVSYRGLWSSAVLATVLFLIMSLQGSMIGAFGLTLLIVPVQTVFLAVAFLRRKDRENTVRLRLSRMAIYAAMLVAMFLHAGYEHRVARAQAEQIVEACRAYETERGHLPAELSELVPEYLPSLPVSFGVIARKAYYYSAPEDGSSARFMYTPELFIRSWYNFEKREWISYGS